MRSSVLHYFNPKWIFKAFVKKPSGRKNERSLPRTPRTNAGECLRRRVSGDIDVVVVGQ